MSSDTTTISATESIKDLVLRDLYYSPRHGFRSMERLYQLAREELVSYHEKITRKDVKTWLEHQKVYTRNKKFVYPKHFRHTFVRDLGEQLQIDLLDLSTMKKDNDGFSYVLVGIEILSRYGFAIPLKKKDATSALEKIKVLLEQFKTRFHQLPQQIQPDDGAEFTNKLVKHYFHQQDIHVFTTSSKRKASIVERMNRTLREKMRKYMEHQGNQRWIDVIHDLIHNYNTQTNRTIRMKPIDVNEENKFLVWTRLFGHVADVKTPRYNVGDLVRVVRFTPVLKGKKYQDYYRKKYQPRRSEKTGRPIRLNDVPGKGPPFSKEIFRIDAVLLGDPVVYKLYSPDAETEILGKYYEEELSLVRV